MIQIDWHAHLPETWSVLFAIRERPFEGNGTLGGSPRPIPKAVAAKGAVPGGKWIH